MSCGCEQRRETLFAQGRAGDREVALILGVPLGVLIYLWLKGSA